jgi:hypothetical protein
MAEQGSTDHREARRRLLRKSIEDESFHRELVRNPKPTIEREFGTSLPENVNVMVHETDPDTIHLVLPSRSHLDSGFDLSEEVLETVSGGTASCDSGLSCWGGCSYDR